MDYFLISLTALLASGLTLFSGFGLGTILMPVMLIFFPVPTAIAVTAVVHLLNNILKVAIFGHKANVKITLKFGLPAVVFAFLGAECLRFFSNIPPLFTYDFFHKQASITLLKLLMACIMIFFACFESLPRFKNISLDQKHMPWGGALSGFFGGLSGHQAAFRSVFLIRSGLSKESFIGTGILIACFVDFTRLIVYASTLSASISSQNINLLALATGSAFLGVWLGSRFVKKITVEKIQNLVAFLLALIACGLAAGLL